MCTHSRLIRNSYTGNVLRVNCGKCKACLQEKAVARANRIRLNYSKNTIPIFCTFTYDNDSIPYIKREHLLHACDEFNVPVYRNCRIFNGFRYETEPRLIDVLKINLDGHFDQMKLKGLKHRDNLISICYYPDIQNFFKRYRINLQRHYGIEKPNFSYFCCSEYGGHSQRAHFHSLLFVPLEQAEAYKSAIDESWPYGNKYADARQRARCYEYVRKDAASYISSYVNSGNRLSPLFKTSTIKQKHSYSHGFGTISDTFSLPSILQKIESGDMSYTKQIVVDGVSTFVDFPIPKYVIHRFFPKFKGFSRFSAQEINDVVLFPTEYRRKLAFLQSYFYDSDYDVFVKTINYAYQRFNQLTGLNRWDYAHYYSRVWDVHKSYVLKHSYDDVYSIHDWLSFYENNNEYVSGLVHSLSLGSLISSGRLSLGRFECNPNRLTYRVVKTNNLELLYDKLCKQRDVTNYCMSQLEICV